MIIVVMGVTGSGKTTIGRALALKLGALFYDADDFHSKANKEKMDCGIPLTDEDRWPWLEAVRAQLEKSKSEKGGVVLACSALKQKYRDFLSTELPIQWAYLKGDPQTIQRRVKGRTGHFAGPELVESQFRDLEEPLHAMVVEVRKDPEAIVQEIMEDLKGKGSP